MSNPLDRPARPWDIFNKNLEKVSPDMAKQRIDICNSCDKFVKLTHQCKECGCIMDIKTKLPNAACPLNKWGSIQVSYKEETNE